MKHLNDIATLAVILQKSSCFHALVIQSPSGWGKSTAVEGILKYQRIEHHCLGSYSTPLGLYNCLADHSNTTIVIDDAAGLFCDPVALAILKAATWPSSGTKGLREIRWNSTNDKVRTPVIHFHGKIIVITNNLPTTAGTDSFLSRTLYLRVHFTPDEIAEMLLVAAQDAKYFEDTALALAVAQFLVSESPTSTLNLRTLVMGFELARANPTSWHDLVSKLVHSSPRDTVAHVTAASTKVGDQVKDFMRLTGLSRRTFFNHRKRFKEEISR